MKRLTLLCLALLAARAFLLALPAHDARFLKVEITYALHEDGSWDMEYEPAGRASTPIMPSTAPWAKRSSSTTPISRSWKC